MTRPVPAAEFSASAPVIARCWKEIGIQGDLSCPELARHSHCRNCPAFSFAAGALLDRELPGEATGLTGQLGAVAGVKERATESVMVFRVGGEWFGLSTLALDEIVGLRPVHSLPHRRNPGLLGLVNVRGELVLCVSVARLLTSTSPDAGPQGRLIVARNTNGRIAFPVDEVQHTHHYSAGELRPLPATVARSPSSLTNGLLPWGAKTISCLDEQLLFEALNRSLT